MRTRSIQDSDWQGVFPVPPIARAANGRIDYKESEKIVRHIAAGGIKNLLYGGNAFLYHLTLAEYAGLLDWLNSLDDDLFCIPSAGPSYGRAMDQAALLARYNFPTVMLLPCGDPRDAKGLERGYRQFSDAAETKLIIYLKDESNFGANKEAGLDAVARLVNDGTCIGIKYAVIRENPSVDPYLDALLARVPRAKVISGIGERPAIQHLRDFQLPGFTTGSGCLAPNQSRMLFERINAADFTAAERIRQQFIPVEDLRDAWGPARVLHAATALAGVAETGPIAPYVSPIDAAAMAQLQPAAQALVTSDAKAAPVPV